MRFLLALSFIAANITQTLAEASEFSSRPFGKRISAHVTSEPTMSQIKTCRATRSVIFKNEDDVQYCKSDCGAHCPYYIKNALKSAWHVVQIDDNITESCTHVNGHSSTRVRCTILGTPRTPDQDEELQDWIHQHQLHKMPSTTRAIQTAMKRPTLTDSKKVASEAEDEEVDDEEDDEEEEEDITTTSKKAKSSRSGGGEDKTSSVAVDSDTAINSPQTYWNSLKHTEQASLRKEFASYVTKKNLLDAVSAAVLIRERGGGVVVQTCQKIRSGASGLEIEAFLKESALDDAGSLSIRAIGATALAFLVLAR